jgi:hypothetical protein
MQIQGQEQGQGQGYTLQMFLHLGQVQFHKQASRLCVYQDLRQALLVDQPAGSFFFLPAGTLPRFVAATPSDRRFLVFLTTAFAVRIVMWHGCVLIAERKRSWVMLVVVPPANNNILLATATQCCSF